MRLTVKRVERCAEADGAAQAAAVRERAALIAGRQLVPLPPRPLSRTCSTSRIDGTGVPMPRGRPPAGTARARTGEPAPRGQARRLFTQDRLDDDGRPVRDPHSSSYWPPSTAPRSRLVQAEGRRRGAAHIRQLVVLGDGAAWIWNLAAATFPEATEIVDLYHAREHLHEPGPLWSSCSATTTRLAGRSPGRPRRRRHRGHRGRRPRVPPRRRHGAESRRHWATSRTTPAHALPVVPSRPVRRLGGRRSQLYDRRPAPNAGTHWTAPAQIFLARAICRSAGPAEEIGKKRSGSADWQAPAERQFAALPVALIACPRMGSELVSAFQSRCPPAHRLHLRTGKFFRT